VPVKELGQVVNELGEPEPLAEGKAVILATELVADHSEMLGQDASKWTE
jgi:hypothetical protein